MAITAAFVRAAVVLAALPLTHCELRSGVQKILEDLDVRVLQLEAAPQIALAAGEKLVVVIRHGQSDWNSHKESYFRKIYEIHDNVWSIDDAPLTPKGICDAAFLNAKVWSLEDGEGAGGSMLQLVHNLARCCARQGLNTLGNDPSTYTNALGTSVLLPGVQASVPLGSLLTRNSAGVVTRMCSNLRRATDTGVVGLWQAGEVVEQQATIMTNHIEEISSGVDATSNYKQVGDTPKGIDGDLGRRSNNAISNLVDSCDTEFATDVDKEAAKGLYQRQVGEYHRTKLQPLWHDAQGNMDPAPPGDFADRTAAGFVGTQQYLDYRYSDNSEYNTVGWKLSIKATEEARRRDLPPKFMEDLKQITTPVVVGSGHSRFWKELPSRYAADESCRQATEKLDNGSMMSMVAFEDVNGDMKLKNCQLLFGRYD